MKNTKHSIIAILLTALVFNACNKEKKAESSTVVNDPIEVIQVEEVSIEEKSSDLHFKEALISFNEKNLPACSDQIKQGIVAYKTETANAKGKSKDLADESIKMLQNLDEKITKDEIKDGTILENTFAKAELAMAHTYFSTFEEIVLLPDSVSQPHFLKTLKHFRNVVNRGNVDAKKILSKGEAIEAKLKTKGKATINEMRDFNNEAKAWIESHI